MTVMSVSLKGDDNLTTLLHHMLVNERLRAFSRLSPYNSHARLSLLLFSVFKHDSAHGGHETRTGNRDVAHEGECMFHFKK